MTSFAPSTRQTTPGNPEIMKFRIYPADRHGRCIQGFCPTVADDADQAQRIVLELAASLCCHNLKYDHIVANAI